MKTHNLRDRFGSRAYPLHIIGSYEDQLKPDEFVKEPEIFGCSQETYREGERREKFLKFLNSQLCEIFLANRKSFIL